MPQLEISLQKRLNPQRHRPGEPKHVTHLQVKERSGKSTRQLVVNRVLPADHSAGPLAYAAMRTAIANIGKAVDEFDDLPPFVKTR